MNLREGADSKKDRRGSLGSEPRIREWAALLQGPEK
jgi:hypothetical protein